MRLAEDWLKLAQKAASVTLKLSARSSAVCFSRASIAAARVTRGRPSRSSVISSAHRRCVIRAIRLPPARGGSWG
jgi:hypothetical protein